MEKVKMKVVPYETKENTSISLIAAREKDIQTIKRLWTQTNQVEFSKTDHWIKVGGIVFNGFTRKHFENIVGIKEE